MDLPLLKRTANFGAVSALHQSSIYIGKMLVQGAVNSGGTEIISAYTATTRIEGFPIPSETAVPQPSLYLWPRTVAQEIKRER